MLTINISCLKHSVTMATELKKKLLRAIFDVYKEWAGTMDYACKKGCASCCTQSVTMTFLEGEEIFEFLQNNALEERLNKLKSLNKTSPKPLCTTNRFARYCLEQKEPKADGQNSWNFEPCIFLEENLCTIYRVRPFGCRSFSSIISCSINSAAEVPPLIITVNTVIMQIIEHIDQGRYWGNMLDILNILAKNEGKEENTTKNSISLSETLPGFLVPPEEEEPVEQLLSKLYNQTIENKPFSFWINNVGCVI